MDATIINSVIDNIAAKLTIPAAELMTAIPSFGVEAFGGVVIGLCALVSGTVCIVKGVRMWRKDDLIDGEIGGTLSFIGAIAFSLGMVGVFLNLNSVILWLYDPKAWAVKYLLGLFK